MKAIFKKKSAGFNMVEIALSLSITALGILVVYGMFPGLITSIGASADQTSAVNIGQGLVHYVRSQSRYGGIVISNSPTTAISFNLGGTMPEDLEIFYNKDSRMVASTSASRFFKAKVELEDGPGANSQSRELMVVVSWPTQAPAGSQYSSKFTTLIADKD